MNIETNTRSRATEQRTEPAWGTPDGLCPGRGDCKASCSCHLRTNPHQFERSR
jgi:hypothetical protein